MNTLNHLAIGSAIGLVVQNPVLALPLALLSHFVADVVPHFGYHGVGGYGEALKHKLSYVSLLLDAIGIAGLIFLLANQSVFVWLAAFLAASPDLMWVYRYLRFERRGLTPPDWKIVRFHQKIQWFEKPIGLIIETAVSIGLLLLIWRLT